MASQKQNLPSFTSILSVLSIVFYCAGFLRVELELNEQKKRINDLENNREDKPPDVPNRDKLTKNTHGKFFFFYSRLIFYRKSIIQNFFGFLFLTENLASPEILFIDILSLRLRGAEVQKPEGEQVTICFLCREGVLKKQQLFLKSR